MSSPSWNGMAWNTIAWNSYVSGTQPPPLLPPPPQPLSLRLRECIRRVGVLNVTLMKESLVVNQQARVFFEFEGVAGYNELNPEDLGRDC